MLFAEDLPTYHSHKLRLDVVQSQSNRCFVSRDNMNMSNEQPANHVRSHKQSQIVSTEDVSIRNVEIENVSILVVDDSPTILHAICALLEIEKGIEIVGRAANGQEAIDAVASLHPEFVLMDVSMPRMNGLAATKFLARHFPSIKIFLMSSEDSPYLREECLAFGAVAFIYKPRFQKELLAAIRANRQSVQIDIQDTDIQDAGIQRIPSPAGRNSVAQAGRPGVRFRYKQSPVGATHDSFVRKSLF